MIYLSVVSHVLQWQAEVRLDWRLHDWLAYKFMALKFNAALIVNDVYCSRSVPHNSKRNRPFTLDAIEKPRH